MPLPRAKAWLVSIMRSVLREDGDMDNADTPIERMLNHLDHLIAKLGENGVALGSDFDGCTVPPQAIGSSAGNPPTLFEAMRTHGYGQALIEKLHTRTG